MAQVSGDIHPIYRLRDDQLPDLHDGRLDDWHAVFPQPALTEADFGPTAASGSPANGLGLDIDVYLGWSASPNRIWAGIQYSHGLCAAGVGGQRCADGVEFVNCFRSVILDDGQAQLYSAAPDGVIPRRLFIVGRSFVRDPSPGYVDAGGDRQTGERCGAVIELAVTPFDMLDVRGLAYSQESLLEAGGIIGLQIIVPGADRVPDGCSLLPWSIGGSPRARETADDLAHFLLVDEDGPAAVAGESWATVKGRPAIMTDGPSVRETRAVRVPMPPD